MTALDIIAMCQARGVQLVADAARIVLKGPQAARDELMWLRRMDAKKTHRPVLFVLAWQAGRTTVSKESEATHDHTENARTSDKVR
jgi:hypothetical protein